MGKKEKKNKTNLIIGGLIILIMVSSGFGVMFGGYMDSGKQKIKYNDILFTKSDNKYIANINNKYLKFDFTPDVLENIELSNEAIKKIEDSPQILGTYDYSSSASEEIALAFFNLNEFMPEKNFIIGSIKPNSFNHPIITCENATEHVPVIYFKIGNKTTIFEEGNCIIAEATGESDILALKDRIAYQILKVME